ncbi:dTDP-Rha--alpha-D-GlcNAc-pyrophosphate polyprenol alpha-3-L-rhamnosyltransferase [Pseudomonas taiwanensis]|nr:glycosyltransferase family 2 protein [Pseudomonas taiwanensis]NWL76810.1 dTDP-Rha--alpha-D-GlcNAc-pyrophosphate polyprenol alpha-3-L-rhamnosyltransferase [Pseudomonas taiwanensis]
MAYTDEAPLEFPIASAEVSIVIVNYNSGTYLSRCLTSCAAQSAEVIIVDNASTDSSLALAQSTAPDGIELKIIRNDTNVGFSRACNQGVALARGNYLLFLNPDCVIEKHAVGWLLQAVDAPDIGMVGGLLLNPDGTEQAGGRRAVPTPWRTFVRAFGLQGLAQRYPRLFDDFLLHQTPLPSEVIDVEAISGACMLVPRHAFDKIGPLDEGYFMHCEDLDWCMRFRIGGLRVSFQPRARVLHYKGRCSVNHPFAVEWHKHRGMVRFYKKFFRHQYPGVLMMTVSLGIWLRCSAVFCYLLIRRPWTQHDENQ